jgi:hypothetical protein
VIIRSLIERQGIDLSSLMTSAARLRIGHAGALVQSPHRDSKSQQPQ